MKRVIWGVVLALGLLSAGEMRADQLAKLATKGERIVTMLCDKSKLPHASGSTISLMEEISHSGACPPLSRSKRQAIALYLQHGTTKRTGTPLDVPADAKCPVCGMFVGQYPKWAAMLVVGDKHYYFDGVKDMMKYYIFDGDFPYNRTAITEMMVSDYYTLEKIPAKEAFYVLDADVYGPMGRELIAFKRAKEAKSFMAEHHGKRIVSFDQIDATMVMRLDGIEQ